MIELIDDTSKMILYKFFYQLYVVTFFTSYQPAFRAKEKKKNQTHDVSVF